MLEFVLTIAPELSKGGKFKIKELLKQSACLSLSVQHSFNLCYI